jgi:hypothetical protein
MRQKNNETERQEQTAKTHSLDFYRVCNYAFFYLL